MRGCRNISCLLSLVVAIAAATTSSAQTAPGAKPKEPAAVPEGVEVQRDLAFKDPGDGGPSLKLDLYLPAERQTEAELPVVVWVHGGGWLKGSKDRCPGAWLATHGYAVASIEYRLTDRAIWPAQIEDCRDAVAWLRANAEEHGFSIGKVGAWGGSAGGHLVALMGTRPYAGDDDPSRVVAVCDFYGPTELLTMPPNVVSEQRSAEAVANSNGAKLLGVTVRDDPEKARDASAIDQVSADDAAFLIVHGSADPGVPLEQSEKFHQRLTEAGVVSELHVIEGAGHGGKEFQSPEVRERILEFFDQHLR